jgi:hypothetical protein
MLAIIPQAGCLRWIFAVDKTKQRLLNRSNSLTRLHAVVTQCIEMAKADLDNKHDGMFYL